MDGQGEFMCFRVDIPVDSLESEYIKSEKQRKHNNYLKIRKTAKRGILGVLKVFDELYKRLQKVLFSF